MTPSLAFGLLALALAAPSPGKAEVTSPVREHYVAPAFPHAGIRGIILLSVSVSAEGTVTNVSVLRAIPALDAAAIEAARQWRYKPATVNGVPQSAEVVEGVECYGSEKEVADAYIEMALAGRQPAVFRVYAISRFQSFPEGKRKKAAKALKKLARDRDAHVASAASYVLEQFARESE